MACKMSDYSELEVVELANQLEEGSTIDTAVSKGDIVGQVMESFAAGLLSKQSHLIVVNSLIKLGVKRDKALCFITQQHKMWPRKNPEVRLASSTSIPFGKDHVKVAALCAKSPEFNIFVKSVNAFNVFCSRRFNAGTWNIKDVPVIKLATIKKGDKPSKAFSDKLGLQSKVNVPSIDGSLEEKRKEIEDKRKEVVESYSSGAWNEGDESEGSTITPPTGGQVANLKELQVLSQFLNMVNECSLISQDIKELAVDLVQTISEELSPEKVAEIKDVIAANG